MNLHESQTAFQQKYPEAGEVAGGSHLDPEQARQFGDIIAGAVTKLSQKPELTKVEQTFIDRTMDLGTRSVIYTHERFGLPLPESESTAVVAQSIGRLQEAEGMPAPQGIAHALHTITGSSYSLRSNPELRVPIEDVARCSMQMLGEMAYAADGMTIDTYLEGNLQNIIAHLEQVESQPEE